MELTNKKYLPLPYHWFPIRIFPWDEKGMPCKSATVPAAVISIQGLAEPLFFVEEWEGASFSERVRRPAGVKRDFAACGEQEAGHTA